MVDLLIVGVEGVQITQEAFISQMGPFGYYFLTLCIFLFAFSSIISNYYYGETNLEFINKHPLSLFTYRFLTLSFSFRFAIATYFSVEYCRFIYGINGDH